MWLSVHGFNSLYYKKEREGKGNKGNKGKERGREEGIKGKRRGEKEGGMKEGGRETGRKGEKERRWKSGRGREKLFLNTIKLYSFIGELK